MQKSLLKRLMSAIGVLVLSTGLASAADLRAKDAAAELAGLAADAAKGGEVRVIVALKAPALDTRAKVSDANRAALVSAAEDQFVARVLGSAERSRGHGIKRMRVLPMVAMSANASTLRKIANDPAVARVYRDEVMKPTLDATVPLIGMTPVFAAGETGSDAIVAILDTGVEKSHEFIGAGRVIDEACYSSNYTSSSNSLNTSTSLCPNSQSVQTGAGAGANCSASGDACSHGTHVAGIVAGEKPNGSPASGVAKGASILPVQVFSYFPNRASNERVLSWTSDQIAGLERVYERRNAYGSKKIRAVNMSLGGGSYSGACDNHPEQPIIHLLRDAGIVTVVAAGNAGQKNAMSAPACISDAISVAAANDSDVAAAFSNISEKTTFFAPGVNVNSSVPGNAYSSYSGTSMAAPHVAGAYAVLADAFPSKDVNEIVSALQSTGKSITDNGRTRPRIQVDKAYAKLGADLTLVGDASIAITRNGDGSLSHSNFSVTVNSTDADVSLGWELSGVPSWLQPSAWSGTTGQSVTFTVLPPYAQTDLLTADVTFEEHESTGPSRSVSVSLAQPVQDAELNVSPEDDVIITVDEDGYPDMDSFDLTLTSSDASQPVDWSVSGVPDWLDPSTVAGNTGSDGETVTFTVYTPADLSEDQTAELVFHNENGSSPDRIINVTVTADGAVIGDGGEFDVDSDPIVITRIGNADPDEDSFDLTIAAIDPDLTAAWELTDYPDWLEPSETEGVVDADGQDVTFDVIAPDNQRRDLKGMITFTNPDVDGNEVSIPVTLDYVAPRLIVKAKTDTVIDMVDGEPDLEAVRLAVKLNAGTGQLKISGLPTWLKLGRDVLRKPLIGTRSRDIFLKVVPPADLTRDLTATVVFSLKNDPSVKKSVVIKLNGEDALSN